MFKLDEIDVSILELLQRDGRMSYSDLSEETHLSRVAVRERVVKLIDSGVINRFTILIDSSKVGMEASVFFDIEVIPNKLSYVAQELCKYEEIKIVYQTTGSTNLHVHAQLENIEGVGEFIHEKLYVIDGIRNIRSHVLLKRFKSELTYI